MVFKTLLEIQTEVEIQVEDLLQNNPVLGSTANKEVLGGAGGTR